jgi:hypothetical protein
MKDGILCPSLVLNGNNAYLNSKHMVMPYPNVANNPLEKSKDNYNFFHSQVCLLLSITILIYDVVELTFFFSFAFELSVVLAC